MILNGILLLMINKKDTKMLFIGLLYRKGILLQRLWQLLEQMGDSPSHSLPEEVLLIKNGVEKQKML